MGVEICFDGYLRSLVSAYQQWWRLYTLTDATGREAQRVEREQIAPAFFDFGSALDLMVQTVDKEKVESQKEKGEEEKKEKIERLPVLEGICKYAAEHVLLVGRPGSGKSTALARLLLQEAEIALSDRNAKIPVLVELRYLPSEANESSVCDRILAFMHKHDPALDIDEAGIKQLLRQGRLLLLVDGVNELPSDRGRAQVNLFRELYQKTCPMIFTTRELSAGGDLGIAKRLEMQPLTEPQMQQFVMAYLPTQGERLLRQLSGRLREFGQTPLLLWMLCSLFQQSEQIPPNLGMVFRAFTVGYGDRIKQDVTLSKDSRAWWGRLLQYLAFKMTCGENLTELQVAISRREAEQILVEFLRGKVEFADDCAVRWLEDLLKHHLIQISNDRIEFRHQLIQEYYAAEWLLGLLPSLSDARLRQIYLNYLKWTEPLALMLELVESEEQAVRVVRLALEVDLRLGARLAGAVKYGFQEKTVGLLLREIEERKIPKLYAIELLGETRSDVKIEFLIQTIKEDNRYIFWKTSEALVKIRSNKAAEVLIECLKSKDSYVRINVVDALGRIGSRNVIEPLIQALKDVDSYVRINAVGALGKIGDDIAVEFLIQSLKDEDSFVCINAAEALGRIGGDKVVESLIQSLDDEYAEVRWNSAEILGDIGSDKSIIPLIRLFKDKDFDVRRKATEALVKIGSNKVIKHLIQVLQDEDYRVRLRAEWTLSKIVDGKPVELLFKELKDENSNVICHSLASASTKAIESLLFSLRTNETDLRRSVAEILGKNSSDRNIESLIAFESPIQVSKDINSEVEDNFVEIINTEVIEVSIKALKDEKSYVRVAAVEELEKIAKDARNLPTLTQQLPHLLTLIPTESSQQALSVITAIQARCKYYNYAIYNTPLQETENYANPVEKILQEIHQTLKTMSETGKYNINSEVVQIVEKNYGQVIGKNSGQAIGKKYANDPALLQTINEITQVLANLQKTHPTATEAEAKDIIEAEFKEIQNNQPNRWATFRQQLLNPERWLNGGKATISEIVKHYAENSVFLKAGVAFLDGFSADEE
ncbi:HEAT repeat domain-containing protein [Pseudanabaena sp. CCNP1317]|jgi:HEAT repeat protein|nr:HEAT repeat domain-containing protein [Pseudanabaena sp. CCNP1317]MEA5485776.1 HEAT repeat domain-containing protein [Pseudanabaena sp. CCNP1317]